MYHRGGDDLISNILDESTLGQTGLTGSVSLYDGCNTGYSRRYICVTKKSTITMMSPERNQIIVVYGYYRKCQRLAT